MRSLLSLTSEHEIHADMASDPYNLTRDALQLSHRYFASRPDLLARGASEDAEAQSSIPAAPAAAAAFTAAQRALANPATSRAFAAGIQRAGTAVSGNTSSPPPAPPPRSVSSEAVDNDSAPPASAAFSAAQRALANPATSRAFAAGIQRASTAASGNTSSTASPPPAPPPRSASSAAVDDDSAPPVTYGRVAAAAQAFSAAAAAPTPPPPRAANPPTHKRTDSASGLVTQKVRKPPTFMSYYRSLPFSPTTKLFPVRALLTAVLCVAEIWRRGRVVSGRHVPLAAWVDGRKERTAGANAHATCVCGEEG